jgi:Domain of unknown function (DUF4328)
VTEHSSTVPARPAPLGGSSGHPGGVPAAGSTRATAFVALTFAALVTVLQVVGAALAWPAMEALQDARDAGLSARDSELTAYDVIALPQLVVVVGAWVSTSIWLSRSRELALRRRRFHHARSPIWVWLGWVVPIVNLWFPYQVVRDVGRATSPTMAAPPAAGWWWEAVLVSMALERLAGSAATGDADAFIDSIGVISALSAVAMVIALVLWTRIVLAVLRDQATIVTAAGPGQDGQVA